jgi:hypothetical protein
VASIYIFHCSHSSSNLSSNSHIFHKYPMSFQPFHYFTSLEALLISISKSILHSPSTEARYHEAICTEARASSIKNSSALEQRGKLTF